MLFVKRRIFTAIVSCVLLATSVLAPAFATDSKGLGEAIVTIRTKLDIPEELTEFDSNINQSKESSSYYVRWFDKEETMSVNATVNSFGDVTSYSIYREEYDRYTPRFPNFNFEQQTEKAKKWIEKVNPHWLSELVLNTDYGREEVNIYSDNTTITFDRYVMASSILLIACSQPFCDNIFKYSISIASVETSGISISRPISAVLQEFHMCEFEQIPQIFSVKEFAFSTGKPSIILSIPL